MSWQFPKFTIPNGSVIGVDDFNRGFQEVAGELGGTLNEHNWRLNCLNGGRAGMTGGSLPLTPPSVVKNGFRDSIARDAAYLWWVPDTPAAASSRDLVSNVGDDSFFIPEPGLLPDNRLDIRETYGWRTIIEARIETSSSMLWVMGSFQIQNKSQPMDFAIRVDGQIISEAKAATAELENDVKGQINFQLHYPITIDCMSLVAEGNHHVELCGRETIFINNDEVHTNLDEYIDQTSGDLMCSVTNRSFIILEVKN